MSKMGKKSILGEYLVFNLPFYICKFDPPLNNFKIGLKIEIIAKNKYFQIWCTITIYLVLAMISCSTHIHNGSFLSMNTTNSAQSPNNY